MAVTDYYLLDYIESSGTQYIDTRIKCNQDTSIECVFSFTNTNNGNNIGYVDSGSTGTNSFGMNIWTSHYYYGYGNNGTSYYTKNAANTNKTIYYQNKNLVYLNNELKSTLPTSNFTNAYNFCIGAWIRSGSVSEYSYCKFYSYKIYDSNILIRNYIPVVRHSDGAVGMYDLVENKFYTNAGSGSFIAGSTLTGSISVSKNINEAGNISGGTGNKFPDGSIGTTLNATINNGYHFLGWYNSSGQLVSTNTSYTYIGPEGASFIAKYAYLDNIVKPNKSLSPINFDFDNSMKGLQFRKWDSPRSPLILDMGANNASGSYRQVFIIGGDSANIWSCCIFTQGDDAYAKKTSLDTTNTTYSATKVGNLLTINFSDTIWGPTWVLWN